MSALLGIDLGISSVKVVVCWLAAPNQSLGSAKFPHHTPQPGHADYLAGWLPLTTDWQVRYGLKSLADVLCQGKDERASERPALEPH
jgi:sugar (pentulose or hexulose) kinase